MQRNASAFLLVLVALACHGAHAARLREKIRKRAAEVATMAADPGCKTGLLSLPFGDDSRQVCCPSYCKECSDYPTCNAAFGKDTKDSSNACCPSVMIENSCEKKPPHCLPLCEKGTPPCIMPPAGEPFEMPDPSLRNAGTDCGEVVDATAEQLEGAKESAEAGALLQKPKKDCGEKSYR